MFPFILTLSRPTPFKAFLRPFELSQRSLKIKISVNFYFNTIFCFGSRRVKIVVRNIENGVIYMRDEATDS